MLKRLAHVCLNVADIHETIDFYCNKLGLPVKFKFEKSGVLFGVYFDLGEQTYLEAFQVRDQQMPVINTGIAHFCLETDDIDAFIADMATKGVPCTEKTLGCDHSWQTWLKDPDGNNFELHQYTARSTQLLGGVVQADW